MILTNKKWFITISTLWMIVLINLVLIGNAFAQEGNIELSSDGTTSIISADNASITLTFTPGDGDDYTAPESPAAYLFVGDITDTVPDVSQDNTYISMTTINGIASDEKDEDSSSTSEETNYGVSFSTQISKEGNSYKTTIQIGKDQIAIGGYYTVVIPNGSNSNYSATFLVSPIVESISLQEGVDSSEENANVRIPLGVFGGQTVALSALLSGEDKYNEINNPFPALVITTSEVQDSDQLSALEYNYGTTDPDSVFNFNAITAAGIVFSTSSDSNIFTIDTTAGSSPQLAFKKNQGTQNLNITVQNSATTKSTNQSVVMSITTFSTNPVLTGTVNYVDSSGTDIPGTIPAFDFTVSMTGENEGQDITISGFPRTVQNDEEGVISFLPENFTFSEPGNYTVTITETDDSENNNNQNIEYNTQDVTYTVSYTVYALSNDSGYGFSDDQVTVSSNLNKTPVTYNPSESQIIFTNENTTYNKPISVTISGSKNLINSQTNEKIPTTGYTFNFTISAQSPNNCPMPSSTTVALNSNDGTFTFAPIEFNTAGTYIYQVAEQKGNSTNITYDNSVFIVTVNITDNNGTFSATQSITKNDQSVNQIAFNNTYTPTSNSYAPVVVNISGTVTLSQSTILDNQFSFTIIPVSVSQSTGYTLPPVSTNRIATNNTAGVFAFDGISLDKPGIYIYKVVQNTSSENYTAGVTYDTTVYTVVVELTSNSNGTLSSTYLVFKDTQTAQNTQIYSGNTLNTNTIIYKNTYNSTAINSLVINGYKELTYNPTNASSQVSKPASGQFNFILAQQGTSNTWETTNNANGTFAFPAIKFNTNGTYLFTVREVNSSTQGYVTDPSTYLVTVVCGSGGTISNVLFSKNNSTTENIIFSNTTSLQSPVLTAAITPTIVGTQTGNNLVGSTINYTVTVSNAALSQLAKNVNIEVEIPYGLSVTSISNDGNFVPTYNNSYNNLSSQSLGDNILSPMATNGAGPGEIVWPTVSELGVTPITYTFTAQVTNASAYTTPVKLLATAENTPITATTVLNGTDIGTNASSVLSELSNSYTVAGTVNIVPNTITPPSGTFTYSLTTLNNGPLPSTTTTINTGNNFTFSPIKFTSPGVYEYSLSQNKGTNTLYTYDETTYLITLTVANSGNTNTYSITPLIQKQITGNNGNTTTQIVNSISFTNEYLGGTSTGTNPYLTVTKTQALNYSTSATTSPLSYSADDMITYFINVTNDGNETITDVQVVDAVPTGVVVSSVNVYNGGSLNNKVITWEIGDIAKGETETVSFSVTVPAGVTTLTNVAQANCFEDPTLESSNEVVASLSGSTTETVSLVKTQKIGDSAFTEMPLVAQANQTVTYQITAVNNTGDTLQNLIIQDTIPTGLSLVTGSITNNGSLQNGNIVTWSIASLPAGQNQTVQFKVTIPSNLANVPYRNVATLNYNGAEGFVTSNTVAINAPTSGSGGSSGTGTPTKVVTKTVTTTTTTTTTTTSNPKTGVNITRGNWILLFALSVALYLIIKQRIKTEYYLYKD